SKLGNVLFTTELARRIEGSGVTVVSVTPGPTNTNFGGGGPSGVMGVVFWALKHTPLLKRADQSAEGIVWAATAPELEATPGALYMRHKRLKLKGVADEKRPTLQPCNRAATPVPVRSRTSGLIATAEVPNARAMQEGVRLL